MNQSPPNDPQRGTSGADQRASAQDEPSTDAPPQAGSAAPEPRAAATPDEPPAA
ncbi:hypothetical protein GTW40_03265, partial [Streptomyces sp. SID4985]|nr:hypothetical protein [Streptomyces sp. SID4985]